MVFNILVSNTDDHPRNHGLLLGKNGWRLAPAFDMNPCPFDIGGGLHILAINELDRAGSLEIALSVAGYIGLSLMEANAIAGEVGIAVAGWKEAASATKIPRSEIKRMETAFARKTLEQAQANQTQDPAIRVKPPTTKRKLPKKVAA
jgi:serine/threonine-protein kinase HipA